MLTLTANRDEFFRRTSAPLAWWEDVPGVLAGDLEGGGTWLGVSRDGRFGALTNYRAPFDIHAGTSTRGKLVSYFLGGRNLAPLDYLEQIAGTAALYYCNRPSPIPHSRHRCGWQPACTGCPTRGSTRPGPSHPFIHKSAEPYVARVTGMLQASGKAS